MKLLKHAKFAGRIPRLNPGRVFCMNGKALWHHPGGRWYVGEDRDVRHVLTGEPIASMVERGFIREFRTRTAAVKRFMAMPSTDVPDSYGPQDQYS